MKKSETDEIYNKEFCNEQKRNSFEWETSDWVPITMQDQPVAHYQDYKGKGKSFLGKEAKDMTFRPPALLDNFGRLGVKRLLSWLHVVCSRCDIKCYQGGRGTIYCILITAAKMDYLY